MTSEYDFFIPAEVADILLGIDTPNVRDFNDGVARKIEILGEERAMEARLTKAREEYKEKKQEKIPGDGRRPDQSGRLLKLPRKTRP